MSEGAVDMLNNMSSPEQYFLDAIEQASHCVLATHVNPDGDAVGSLLACKHILEGMGKEVLALLEAPLPSLYDFLPGAEGLQVGKEALDTFLRQAHDGDSPVLVITLDCGDGDRLGSLQEPLQNLHPFAVIDHHQGHEGFGDPGLNWVDASRSSTGEMVYDLAIALEQKVSRAAGECLYMAIMTDTGHFRYEGTCPHTFEVAGKLVESGVVPGKIHTALYDSASVGKLRLMQEVLATLEIYAEDRIALISLTQDMLERCGASLIDADEFVNLPRSIQTVDVAVFIKQSKPDLFSVSLRAKGGCDVSRIARHFGGGGHKNASGFKMEKTSIDALRSALLPVLEQGLVEQDLNQQS